MLSSRDDMVGEHIQCPMCEAELEVPTPKQTDQADNTKKKSASDDTRRENIAEEKSISFRRDDEDEHDELDMTPMVDVTFLLLIFFMVTASFALQKSFEVPAPQEKKEAQARSVEQLENDPKMVIVRIGEYNTFYLTGAAWAEEQEAPTKQDLLVKLREARQGDGGSAPTEMMVMAHGDAHHEKIVDALDAGTAVGMENVKLVTVEDDEI